MADSIKVRAKARVIWDTKVYAEGDVFEIPVASKADAAVVKRYVDSEVLEPANEGAKLSAPRNVQPLPGSPQPSGAPKPE